MYCVFYPQTRMSRITHGRMPFGHALASSLRLSLDARYARGLRKTRTEGSKLKQAESMRLAQANTDEKRIILDLVFR